MDEQSSLAELSERLMRESRVWVRVAADRVQDDWQLTALEVTTGAPPPGWRRVRWCYSRAIFIAAAPSGRTVARWLMRARVSMRSLSLPLALDGSVHTERHPSRFAGAFEVLPWPCDECAVGVRREMTNTIHDELVAADAPAFLGLDRAATAFFGLPERPNRSFSGRELVVREQDQRARIDHVRVRPIEVVATISGTALNGARLTLGGADMPTKTLTSRSRTVRLATPDGLPTGAWLALHRGEELLDRRILDARWGPGDFDFEPDLLNRAEILISGGEGTTTEFKQQLPGKDPRPAMKTIAAFANSNGGTLLFGVTDEGEPVGLGSENTRQGIDRLTSLINDWVRPRVEARISEVEVGGVRLLLLVVPAGANPPYAVGTTDKKLAYYIRTGATSSPASPGDIQVLVRTRLPALI